MIDPGHRYQEKVILLVTSATSIILLGDLPARLRRLGLNVHVWTGPAEAASTVVAPDRIVPSLVRPMRPFADLRALINLVRLMRKERPVMVHASTPKAGLLGTVAALIAQVPVRLYLVRGLVLETASGPRRWFLLALERLACRAATHVYAVSPSLRDRMRRLRVEDSVGVIAWGSSRGVDVAAFTAERFREMAVDHGPVCALRTEAAMVLGFVGRVCRDKGIDDLLIAFDRLRTRGNAVRLLIIGDLDATTVKEEKYRWQLDRLVGAGHAHVTGWVADIRPYLGAIDVLVHPSRREGFGNVIIEAAACRIPTVGYEVTGVRDAIVDGVTGRLVPCRDVESLTDAIESYIRDPAQTANHGTAGRHRAEQQFRSELVSGLWAEEIHRLCRG